MDDCKMKSRLLIAVFAAVLCLPAVGGDKSKPYQGKVHAIPGLIEAEHYDEGKPGVAYSDVDEVGQSDGLFTIGALRVIVLTAIGAKQRHCTDTGWGQPCHFQRHIAAHR